MKYKFVHENTDHAQSGNLPVITKENLDSLPPEVAKAYLENKIIEPSEGVSIEEAFDDLNARIAKKKKEEKEARLKEKEASLPRQKAIEFTASDGTVMVVYADDTKELLSARYNKPLLLELSLHLETGAPEDNNKSEIAQKILEKQEVK